MDAREYLVGMSRMCTFYGEHCEGCELKDEPCDTAYADPDRLIDVVSRWVKAHPGNTRQSEILKMFPNAAVDLRGVLAMCPLAADATMGQCPDSVKGDCKVCKKLFWGSPIEKKEWWK